MTKIFRSVRFNIFLGALITAACAVGTFVPQTPEMPERAARFQESYPQWSRLFDFFGLFDLYHSYWFMGLLGLMAFDIVLCKLWSKPPDHGLVALPPEATREQEAEKHLAQKEGALKLKPFQAAFESGLAFERAVGASREALSAAGFHLHDDFHVPAGAAFVATKHRLQRWGSYLAHIALVIILLGALVKGLFGFVEMVPVLEGRSRAMEHKPDWEVFVDKFTIDYYEGTREPKRFSSVMRVERKGEVLGQKTILVNDPLSVGNVRFYQATWGAGGMFRSVTLKIGKQELQMAQRTPTKIPGTPFAVEADMMMPNFTITDGGADTASLDLKNPAVRLKFHTGPHKTRPLWLVESDPELCFIESDDGTLERAPKPPFQLAGVDPILFSGIQVASDPGYPITLGGCILWLIGTCALFYMHRRRLWVLIEPAGDSSRVSVGGWSSRGRQEFEAEFARLMQSLRAAMAPKSEITLSLNPLTEVPQGEKA
jgi:cytochrome c biogenesis protein